MTNRNARSGRKERAERYSRQELFSPIGPEGQKRLQSRRVLLVGAGALGTSAAEMLVRAGVGKVTIADRDVVEWSNLQRQQLYTEDDAKQNMPKAVAAARRLREINSEVEIVGLVKDVTAYELENWQAETDLIVDATDNFDTRFIINDVSQKHRIPWIYGACAGSYGLTYTFIPGKTPCLRCLLDQVPFQGMTCDTVGVIAPIVQMVTAHQTAEALKILVGDEEALRGTLCSFDLWNHQYASIRIDKLKKPDCLSCGEHPVYPDLDYAKQTKSAVLCGRNTVQIRPGKRRRMNFAELSEVLQKQGEVEYNAYRLTFAAEHCRMTVFADGRVLVHGTDDEKEAKTLYYRYVGA